MGYDEAMSLAKERYPDAFEAEKPARKKGVLAQASKGLESLISSGRTAGASIFGDKDEAAKAGLARSRDIGSRYEEGADLEKVKKAYEERGLLSAAGEAVSQVPGAIAEQGANIAALAASGRLGSTLGSAFGAKGRLVGGALGALTSGTAQALGQNVERQAAEQERAGEPVNIDMRKAVGTAIPSAALDVAGTFIPLGGRIISKLTGIPAEALLGRSAAQVAKLAEERLAVTLAKGLGTGALAEIPTEIAQQMLERYQAGLSLTDPSAMKEYGETAYQVGLLAPLGAVGRVSERSGARTEVAEKEKEADQQKRALRLQQEQLTAVQQKAEEEAKAQALEAEKQTPKYAIDIGKQYDDLLAQFNTQRAAIKKPGANPSLIEKAEYKDAQDALKELQKQLQELVPEYRRTKPLREQETEKARVAGMSPYDYMLEQTGTVSSAPTPKGKPDLEGYYEQQIAVPGQAQRQALEGYVAKQMDLANTQALADEKEIEDANKDYVKYLVANPVLAKQALQNRTPIPGLTKKRQSNIYDALQLEINKIEAAERATGAAVTERTQKTQRVLEEEEEAALEDQRQMRQAYEMQQEGRLATDIEQIKPLPETTSQGDLFGGTPQRVNMPVAGTRVDIDSQIAELKKELDVARSYGAPTAIERRSNRERVSTLLEQIRDLEDRKAKMESTGTATTVAGTEPLNRAEQKAIEALANNDKGELNFLSGSKMLRDSIYRLVTWASVSKNPLDPKYLVNTAKNNLDAAKEVLQYAPDWMLENVTIPDELKIGGQGIRPQLGRLPRQERALRDATAEREAAYGKFKSGDKEAKQDVMDGLLKEILLVRGQLKPETITEIEKELSALLDSSARYGNDITPELDAISTRWRAGTKYSAFGPAEAIPTTTSKDMLLGQMDRAYAQRQRYDAQTMSILDQIADNYGAVTANEDRRNLIGEWLNRATTGNLNPEMTRDVQAALRTLEEGKRSETETPTRETAFGTATKPTQTAVLQELGAEFMPEQVAPQAATRIVNGKVQYVAPEDRGPIQGSAAERYAPTQKGTIFESFAELNRYLASDYLKAARQEMGITRETVARMELQIKEHETKIANIRKQTDALKARKAMLEKSKLSEDRAAKNIIADAEVRMESILKRLSDELEPLRLEYMQVRSQVDQLADRSEETSRLIANNIANFKEMDDRAVDAAQETQKAKEELRQARNKLGSLAEKLPGIQAAQQKVIVALERQRNPLLYESRQQLQDLQKQLSKARVTQPRTVARLQKEIADLQELMETQRVNPYIPSSAFITFLNNDLRLQLDLREETRKLNKAGKELLDLGLQLELAAADLDVNLSTHPEIVAIKQEIGTAKEMGVDAVRALDNDLALLDSEIEKSENASYVESQLARGVEKAIKEASESRGFGAQMADVPIEPLSSAERETIEARNKAQLEDFQAGTARLQALSGQRIDFSKRREMLDLIKTATKDFAELDARIQGMEEGVLEMQVRVELVQIKLDEATEKAASYRGPRKNLKEAKALFAQIEDFKKQIEAGNKRVETLQNSIVDYEKSKITKQKALSEAERATSSDPEVYAEVTKLIDDRIAKLEKTISKKQEAVNKSEEAIAKLSRDIKAKKLAWAEGTVTPETLKNLKERLANLRSSQKERRKRFNEFLKEREVLQARRSNRLGITRTDVLTGKKVEGERTKKAPAQIQEQIDAENERAAMYDYRFSGLQGLEKQMAGLSATPEPKTAKAKANRAERIRALQEKINQQIDLVNEVLPPKREKISQATRIQSGAPSKLRGGTEQSKANVGISKQPIVESRTPAPITSEKAVADANAFAERIAAAKDKTTLDAEFKAKEYEQQNQILDAMEDNRVRLIKFITRSEDELAEIGTVPSGNPTLADRRDKLNEDVESAQFMLDRVGDDINRLLKEQIVPYSSEDFTQLSGTEFSKVSDEDIDTTYDPRYEFSRGTPVQGLTTTELRSELRKAVGDEDTYANKVSVYKSVGEFLQAKPNYKGQIPFDAKAFVDPDTERAYMFADNIAKNEGLAILLHEVGVHIGFRNFFNAGQFKALANAVRSWSKAPANTLEGRIGRAAEKRVRDAATPADQIDDELIAYAVEEAVKAGVNPAGVKGGSAIVNWLRVLVKAFTKALEKFGLAPESIKVGDLVNMAYGAAQLELKGTWHGTAGAFKEFDHAYMGMGEGQQAFGWGTYRAQNKRVAETYAVTAVDAAMQRAYDDPAFVKWLDESAPTIDGKSLKNLESKGHREYFNRTNPNLVSAVPNAQGKVPARPLIFPVFKNKVLAPKPLPLTYKMELVDFPDNVRATVLNALREVSDTKLYNGVAFNVVDAVKDVLKSSTSKENKAALTWVENNADRIGGGAQKKSPLVLPPEGGAVLRTLHEQREDAFFNLDNQIPEQSDKVQTALEKIFYSLTNQQKARFNRELEGDPNPSGKDVYGAFKLAIGNQKTVSERMASFGIAGNKFLDHYSRGKPVTEDSRYNYVDFLDKDQGAAIIASDINPVGPASGLLFSRKAQYGQDDALTSLSRQIIAQPKSFSERLGRNIALETEMNLVDMRAGLREALKAGAKEMGDTKNFVQAMYSVTKSDQKMAVVSSTLMEGPMELYTDDKGFHGIRSTGDNSAKDVFDAIGRIPGGNARGRVDLATTYMIAQRAANKGLSKLDLGALGVTEAELKAAMADVNANPKLRDALEVVRSTYNAYNAGLIKFLASTGAIPKETAAKLLKDGDYVPFYRVRENGMADLVFSDEVTINIGDVRYQPYLAELKGGETRILPLTESLPRNTLLITDKALTNLAARNVGYAFQAIGAGKGPVDKEGKTTNAMPIHKGKGPTGADIVRFNQEPDPADPKDTGDRWVRVKTDDTIMGGIPAELIVKSLEGAHLTLPAFLKIGGLAGDLLRSGVTRMPIYIARQLIRDPMAASFTGGLNYNPLTAVVKATTEFVRMTRGTSKAGEELIKRGLVQSGIFTGDPDDIAKMALQLAGNQQGAVNQLFATMDRAAMRADAATRALVFQNAIKNGLSEVEADLMTMDSMNFYKRGLSPTVQYASRLIPFFNAQIQGLNVLYKAATGQMPFEEQQKIKQKFFNNAMLLVGVGVVYAMAMEDDEAFKRAKPKDKYSNFFIPVPGVEEPFKLPIPYEAGWFFSLAVAAVDAMKAETDGKQQFDALRDMFLMSIPGYSSKFMPQIIKPAFEVYSNKNFYTGSDIESQRMQDKTTAERFNISTTEAAKSMSKMLPMLSPIQIEHISNGYFGQLPLIIAAAANGLFRKETQGEAPEKRITDMPFIGSSFQKKYGGADADVVYRIAKESKQAKDTYDSMLKQGRAADAKEFLADNRTEIVSAGIANQYRTQMGRLRADEERITGMAGLSGEEKRKRIDRINDARQAISEKFEAAIKRIEVSGKT
jgi:phage shock protein A